MLRACILLFTLLLITFSAAQLGRDERLTQVLRLTKTPMATQDLPAPSSSLDTEDLPPETPASSAASDAASSAASDAASSLMGGSASLPGTGGPIPLDETSQSQPPRFVPDAPPPAAQSDDPPQPLAEIKPGDDPSAHAQLSAAADEQSEPYEWIPPSEQQKLSAAEPFVKELFALTEHGARQLSDLADEALAEYLALAPDRRSASLPALIEKYLPRATALQQQCDAEAEALLTRMTAALAAIGADDAIVRDARDAYTRSKQQEFDRYTSMFAELPS